MGRAAWQCQREMSKRLWPEYPPNEDRQAKADP